MKQFVFAAAAALLTAAGAHAADLGGGYKDGPAAEYVDPWHLAAGDVFVRVRAVGVLPTNNVGDVNLPASVVGGISVNDQVIPEVDLTYFLTKNLSIEVIAGVTEHFVKIDGGALGGTKVGHSWLLPPTALLQYHFDTGTKFKPYVGAGVNYTTGFGEGESTSSGAVSGLKVGSGWGAAVQAGFDYKLAGNWFVNVDFKKIWVELPVALNYGAAHAKFNYDVDPILVGVGIGYKFSTGYAPLK